MNRFILGLLIFGILSAAHAVDSNGPYAITQRVFDEMQSNPMMGNIAGVKLSIPPNYLFGPVEYKGVDIWNAKSYENRPKHPTFENEFDDFGIKIRQTNFKPIESSRDLNDYTKLGNSIYPQPPENRWLDIEIRRRNNEKSDGNLKGLKEAWLKNEAHDGPFQKTIDVWGLEHYISTQTPGYKGYGIQREFFFDAETEKTLLKCDNHRRNVVPYDIFPACEIDFVIPGLIANIYVRNISVKDDLKNWREIEQGVEKVVQSFMVQ